MTPKSSQIALVMVNKLREVGFPRLLNGAVYKQNKNANQILYGRRVTAKQILIDGDVPSPQSAGHLDSVLSKYSPSGGRTFARL